jgi:hypothetical protein
MLMKNVLLLILFMMMLVILSGYSVSATQTPTVAPDQRFAPAADALAAKFKDHQFIFIRSTHGDAKIDEFLMCLCLVS